MITNKFDYQPIPRETITGTRYYATSDGNKLPSVTSILSKTASFEKTKALSDWRKRMGAQNAQQITTEAANTGTAMHKKLEQHCLGTLKPPGSNIIQQQSHKMAEQVINKGLINVTEYWGLEVPLYYKEVYAGTTDLVGCWKGAPAIIDFKQTNKPKTKEMIENYFLQLVAYSTAHNHTYGTDINCGVILMCSRACEYQEFVVEGSEFNEWTEKWWNKVELYYEKLIASHGAQEE